MGLFNRLRGFMGGGRAFRDTLDYSIDRANVRFIIPPDSALYLGSYTRTQINEKAEWLWQNFGIVKEGVAGIARHTVGKGISLQIDSDDDEWNQLAEDDFEAYALTAERCDLAGRRNFYEAQTTALEQRILRGEFFAAKTENPEWGGEPCFQIYESQEICSPDRDDMGIVDGVALNAASRAVAYHIRNPDGKNTTPLDRSRMIHWFKPHAVNQVRGISDLAQAVNPLVDVHELMRLTTRSAKAHQLVALVFKGIGKKKTRGAMGALRNAATNADGTANADTAQLEKIAGAAGAGIAYLNEEGSADLITSASPNQNMEAWITNVLMPNVCAAWGVPAEFFWSIAKLGGANTRFILSKADLLFHILGDGVIHRFCTPVAFRYLQHRIAIGALRAPTDPAWAQKLSWQTPPRVTVDNGNEGAMHIEQLANGLITLRQYCNARGLNYRHEMRQWIREPIEFVKMLRDELKGTKELDEAQKKNILDRAIANLPVWRPAKPGAVVPPANEQPAKPMPEPDEDDTPAAA